MYRLTRVICMLPRLRRMSSVRLALKTLQIQMACACGATLIALVYPGNALYSSATPTSHRVDIPWAHSNFQGVTGNKSTSEEPWLDSLRIALLLSGTPSSHPRTSEGVPRDSIGLPSSHLPSLLFQGAHMRNVDQFLSDHSIPVLCYACGYNEIFSLWSLLATTFESYLHYISDFKWKQEINYKVVDHVKTTTFVQKDFLHRMSFARIFLFYHHHPLNRFFRTEVVVLTRSTTL